jgi:hypothetical protein
LVDISVGLGFSTGLVVSFSTLELDVLVEEVPSLLQILDAVLLPTPFNVLRDLSLEVIQAEAVDTIPVFLAPNFVVTSTDLPRVCLCNHVPSVPLEVTICNLNASDSDLAESLHDPVAILYHEGDVVKSEELRYIDFPNVVIHPTAVGAHDQCMVSDVVSFQPLFSDLTRAFYSSCEDDRGVLLVDRVDDFDDVKMRSITTALIVKTIPIARSFSDVVKPVFAIGKCPI